MQFLYSDSVDGLVEHIILIDSGSYFGGNCSCLITSPLQVCRLHQTGGQKIAAIPNSYEVLSFEPEALAYDVAEAIDTADLHVPEISRRLLERWGTDISWDDLKKALKKNKIEFQLAIQILSICGVRQVQL